MQSFKFFEEKNYQRNPQVLKCIDEKFSRINPESWEGYMFLGDTTYSLKLFFYRCQIENIIRSMINENRGQVIICDIGAGFNKFNRSNNALFTDKICSYALSAHLFTQPSNYYRIKNAELFNQAFEENIQFNLIVSSVTFVHFVDPIGALVDTYLKLKVGGVLIVDRFDVRGCGPYLDYIIRYLQDYGFNVSGNVSGETIESFIIKKTLNKPVLTLPILFKEINEGMVVYQPNSNLKKYSSLMNINQDYLHAGVQVIEKMVQNKSRMQACMECHCLEELLESPRYHSLNLQQKNLMLLYINSRETVDINLLMNHLYHQLRNHGGGYFCYRMLVSGECNLLFSLSSCAGFRALSCDVKRDLIKYAAILDIVDYGKHEFNTEYLQKSGLPANEFVAEKSSLYPTDILDFSDAVAGNFQNSY